MALFIFALVALVTAQKLTPLPQSFTSSHQQTSTFGSNAGQVAVDLSHARGWSTTRTQNVFYDCSGKSKIIQDAATRSCTQLSIQPDECLDDLNDFEYMAFGSNVQVGSTTIGYNVQGGNITVSLLAPGGFKSVTSYANFGPYQDKQPQCSSKRSMNKRQFGQAALDIHEENAGCSKIVCGAVIIACAAVCYGSLGTACVSCLGPLAGACGSCFP